MTNTSVDNIQKSHEPTHESVYNFLQLFTKYHLKIYIISEFSYKLCSTFKCKGGE